MNRVFIAAIILILTATGYVCAQQDVPAPWERPDLWIHVQDSLWVYRYSGGDTLSREKVSASYTFSMAYDSASHVFYNFTEPTLDGVQLRLLHWKYKRVVNASPGYLNFNSRTENFMVHTGDTVGFFKEWSWLNPVSGVQDPAEFRTLDTLAYVVYLVRAADSGCVALIDSMMVMPSPEPAPPIVFGISTIAGVMRFVVPSTMDGDSMFIGVGAYARGPGPYNFSRRDAYSIGASNVLNSPVYQISLRDYNRRLLVKRSVEEFNGSFGAEGTGLELRVVQVADAPNEILVDYRDPDRTATVRIYSADGALVGSPASIANGNGRRMVRFRFAEAGAYVVAVQRDARILTTYKLIIQ